MWCCLFGRLTSFLIFLLSGFIGALCRLCSIFNIARTLASPFLMSACIDLRHSCIRCSSASIATVASSEVAMVVEREEESVEEEDEAGDDDESVGVGVAVAV